MGPAFVALPLCGPEPAVCVAPRSWQEDAGQVSGARLSRPWAGVLRQQPTSVPCQAWAAHPGRLAGIEVEPGAARIQSLPAEQSPARSSRRLTVAESRKTEATGKKAQSHRNDTVLSQVR